MHQDAFALHMRLVDERDDRGQSLPLLVEKHLVVALFPRDVQVLDTLVRKEIGYFSAGAVDDLADLVHEDELCVLDEGSRPGRHTGLQ